MIACVDSLCKIFELISLFFLAVCPFSFAHMALENITLDSMDNKKLNTQTQNIYLEFDLKSIWQKRQNIKISEMQHKNSHPPIRAQNP